VPVQDEDERYLAYHPEKGMQLLGFVDAEGEGAVPRYYLGCSVTKGCFVMVGEGEGDALAVSALARAMKRDKLNAGACVCGLCEWGGEIARVLFVGFGILGFGG